MLNLHPHLVLHAAAYAMLLALVNIFLSLPCLHFITGAVGDFTCPFAVVMTLCLGRIDL